MYVVYKGTGGLIHMLLGLVYCIDWCVKHNATLIIDVKGHRCFQHNISDFFVIDNKFKRYYENYDNIDKNLKFKRKPLQTIIDTPHVEVDRGLGNFTHFYRIENIDIRRSLDNYQHGEKLRVFAGPGDFSYIKLLNFIKVKPEIITMIKDLKLIEGDYCGIHFRNTDRKNDIIKYINRAKAYKTIYLATDDATAYNMMKTALPNHTIIQYNNPLYANGKPIHYMEDDKYKLTIHLLIDIYYLYKSKNFIDSPSSLVSRLITYMKKKNKSIFD